MTGHPYQNTTTTELILTFPDDYPNSRTQAEDERRQELDAEYEAKLERYIADNYGDCGAPIRYTDAGYREDYVERMIETYGVGPAYDY